MSNQTKYLKTIIDANKNKNLAIFVGAGISKSSDTNEIILPTWSDLIEGLKQELGINNEPDYLKIAELYYLAFGEYNYKNKIKEYFPENILPSRVHREIFEINPQIIITTNWDNLLEKTIEEFGYFYDVIKSDNDLVKSQSLNKLIKMHGDFTNYNIVFKESDYINYSQNFPLIENYIKSILSTHVILFIGYSYNDINLKQIINWIQNHSKARPPAYLTIFKENQIQKEYLKSFGINSLIINCNSKDKTGYNTLMYEFLHDIKFQKYFKNYDNDNQIIEYLLNRIIHLDELDALMLKHISTSITNCRFIFDGDSRPILFFLNEYLLNDLNLELRNIYKKFIEILKRVDEKKVEASKNLLKIFSILSKARIKGIVISEERSGKPEMYIPFSEYIENDNDLAKYMNFQFELSEKYEMTSVSAYYDYNSLKIQESYNKTEFLIKNYTKQKKFVKLFIQMFNRNILLRYLQTNLYFLDKKYLEIETYDLKNKYDSLPEKYKVLIEPIFNYLMFDEFFQINFMVDQKLEKSKKNKSIVENGGMYWKSEPLEDRTKHLNLLHFYFKNGLMVDNYNEFISLNKKYVFISLNEFSNEKEVKLEKVELYSCIKFFRKDELKKTFQDFKLPGKNFKSIIIKEEDFKWIVESSLENIIKFLIIDGLIYEQYRQYFINTLYVLSHVKLNEEQLQLVLSKVSKLLDKGKNIIDVYNSINYFFGKQYFEYKGSFKREKVIDLIELLINKLITKKINPQEFDAIIKSKIYNLFNVANSGRNRYKNFDLINKLLNTVKRDFKIEPKLTISQNFIIHIYSISNKRIKREVSSFLLGIDISESESSLSKIMFSLHLAENNIKDLTKEDKDNLNEFLREENVFNNFKFQLINIRNLLNTILDSKIDKALSETLKTINRELVD